MGNRQITVRSSRHRFAWQYALCARLVNHGAPLSETQLADLSQAVHALRGHLDPIAVADEILLTWPFDVTEWGGLR
jgi:hypothetical protein